MSKTTGIAEQILSLPKGGGTIQGLGEKFKPDLHMGTGVYNIPLDIPNGPNDIAPKLSLSYNTASGNGPFGMGFSLNLLAISRSIKRFMPEYTDKDPLVLEGAGNMIETSDGVYSIETDPYGWKIERLSDGFKLTDKNGVHYHLGTTEQSRIFKVENNRIKIFKWLLEEIEDPLGYKVSFKYLRDGENLYIKKIDYSIYAIEFNYEKREDIVIDSKAGFSILTGLRCSSIDLNLSNSESPLLRTWSLGYKEAAGSKHSLLHTVKLTGFDDNGNSENLPVLTLDYSSFKGAKLEKFKGEFKNVLPDSFEDGKRELVDFDGDGLADLLEIRNGKVEIWQNRGNCVWSRPKTVDKLPLPLELNSQSVAFADMEGNGTADLIFLDRPITGYYPHLPGGGFGKPIFWDKSPHASLKDSNTRLIDLNGDGITDLLSIGKDFYCLYYRDKEKGWTTEPVTIPLNLFPPVDINDAHVYFADMTGDGLQDIVKVDSCGVKFWPYLGNGIWGEKRELKNVNSIPLNFIPQRMFLADIDGDGCSDLIYVDFDRVLYWINTGGSFLSNPVEISHTPGTEPKDIRLADMKGTGTVGVLWAYRVAGNNKTEYFYLDLSGSQKPYLLDSIDNGMGLKTSIKYSVSTLERQRDSLLGKPWNTFLPFPVQLVSAIVTCDLVTNIETVTSYKYHEGHYDGIDREFAGFKLVEVLEEGDDSTPSMLTKNMHHLGCNEKEPLKHIPEKDKFHLKCLRGKVLKTEVWEVDITGSEYLFYNTINNWSTKTLKVAGNKELVTSQLDETTTTHFDNDLSSFRITSTKNLEYDNYGNVLVQQQKAYDPENSSDEKILITRIYYAVSNEERFVNKPSRVIQTDNNQNVLSLTIRYYDNLPEGQIGNKGLITNQEFLAIDDATVNSVYSNDVPDLANMGYHRKDGENGWWAFGTSYEIEDLDNVYSGKVINTFGDVTKILFEANRIHPEKLIDAMGNTTFAAYDFRANKLKALTDTNGSTIEEKYDSLGRLIYTIEPGATSQFPTESYKYLTDSIPACILCEKRPENGSSDTIRKKVFLDGSGRVIEERILRKGVEFVQKSCIFSSRGLVKEQFVPFTAKDETYQKPHGIDSTKFEYDALGRPLKMINPDGSFKKIEYTKNIVYIYDEEDTRTDTNAVHSGTPLKNIYDCTGRISEVSLNLQNRWISTRYSYDLKGNLLEVSEPEEKKTNFIYDNSGNPISIQNCLTGNSVFVYDALGNRREKRNSKGEKILFSYDCLGRLQEIRDANLSSEMSQYTYNDTNNPYPPLAENPNNSLGRAVKVIHQGGEEIYDYDALGRIIKKTVFPKGLPGTQLVFDYSHRADGQISSITYPAYSPGAGRMKVLYEYDTEGRLQRIPGFVKKVDYNERGQRTKVDYNNGISSVYSYDDKTFRVLSCITTDSSGNIIDNFIYHYDFVGNIIEIESADQKLSTEYTYDDLYRLTRAVTQSGTEWNYSYNDLSDLTFKSDVGDLLYDNVGKLYQVGNDSFIFNEIGQLVSSPIGNFSYDSAGKLIMASKDSEKMEMSYDHQGKRVSLSYTGSDKTSNIFTPDEMISIEDNIMYLLIFDGNQCIARIRQDNGVAVYLHHNHLGSTSKVTGPDGKVLQSIYYDPFGSILENKTTVGTEEIRTLFAGKEYDLFTGLVCMSSRYYCPQIGRFITPDTIIPGVYNPMSWNRYSYVLNNPLKYVDPTGHFWDDIGDWFKENWKTVVAAVAVVAVIVLTVVTFGAGLIGVGALVAVGVGMAAGGVVGGIAASQAGGDVLLGVLTGMALGGASSLAGAGIGAGMTALFGNTLASTLISGTLSGAVTGAAMGLTAGFAGGVGTASQIWEKVWKGALTGAITGFIFSLATYGFQHGWFTGPKVSFQKPTPESLETTFAKSAEELGKTKDVGSAGLTFAKELGKSFINTDKGYPILNVIFGQVAAPIWQTGLVSASGGIIVLDYGDDILKLLKEAGVEIKKEFKW